MRSAPGFRIVVAALVALGTLIRIPQLGHLLAEAYAFRQTQTAFVVREYAQNGIDLFHTPLPVFGIGSDVPMEFPLWQGTAALIASTGIPVDVAARLLGLICFQAAAVLLAILVSRWHGRVVAVVAVAMMQFLPFGLLWGASSLIDFGAVALALLMVVGIDRWLTDRSIGWLIAGGVGAVLGFLVKVTTIPSWGLLLVVSVLLLVRARGFAESWRRILIALIGPVIGLVAALAWTAYADAVKRSEPLTEFITSSALRDWNFGTLQQRIQPSNWIVILDRVAQEIAGPALVGIALAVIAAIMHRDSDTRWRSVGWIAVAVSGPLVFFNLYVVHSYYLIAVYPAIVTAMAIGAVWLFRALPVDGWRRGTLAAAAGAALLATTAFTPLGSQDVAQFAFSNATPAISNVINERTEPDDRVILIGCDWDPTWLYYAEREGMMFRNGDAGDTWSREPIDAYAGMFSCRSDLDPADYLPDGHRAVADDASGYYRVEPIG